MESSKCLEGSPKHKVAQCPKCGFIQITTSEDRLKCFSCYSTRKFRVRGAWNVKVLKMSDCPREAAVFCKRIKMELGK